MKIFIKYCLLFILPAYLLLAIVDYVFSQSAKRSSNYTIEAWYDLMNGDITADVVVMGSSRAWEHVNPLILDSILSANSYNLGMDGRSFDSQILKYHLYRERNSKPKLIIQNIDVFSLINRAGIKKIQFFPYFWDKSMRATFFPVEPFTVWEKYLPMYRFVHINSRSEMPGLSAFIPDGKKTLTKGYRGETKTWNGMALAAVDSIPFLVSDTIAQQFETYLAEAKAEGIEVIFVYCPIYIGATQKMTSLKSIYDYYEQVAGKYMIPILDYTHMSLCEDTSYFYNAMHLNKKGSDIFSDSLANDIKKMGILK